MRHTLGDPDAVAFEGDHLVGVVGQEADHTETELPQHFRRWQVYPLVGIEAQLLIGVERVETGILQPVRAQLIDEPDATSLLRQIKEHTAAGLRDRCYSTTQLVPAIAA